MTSGARSLVAAGAIIGAVWAAVMRAWMVQLARADSYVTWLTFLLLLLPGAITGALVGWASYHRVTGRRSPRRLWLAPAVLASAILDPTIFEKLIRNGEGGGSLIVVATALAGGHACSRRRWSLGRVITSIVTVLGLVMVLGIGGLAGPLSTPRGAWTGLLGLSSVSLLVLASALTHDSGPAIRSSPVYGALAGLAWAGGLRGLIAAVEGPSAPVSWASVASMLVPGLVGGVLLGLAISGVVRRKQFAWSGGIIATALVGATIARLIPSARVIVTDPTPQGLWIAVLFVGLALSPLLVLTRRGSRLGVTRSGSLSPWGARRVAPDASVSVKERVHVQDHVEGGRRGRRPHSGGSGNAGDRTSPCR